CVNEERVKVLNVHRREQELAVREQDVVCGDTIAVGAEPQRLTFLVCREVDLDVEPLGDPVDPHLCAVLPRHHPNPFDVVQRGAVQGESVDRNGDRGPVYTRGCRTSLDFDDVGSDGDGDGGG